MKIVKGKLLLSPTDLTRFYESEFGSWMDHYYEAEGNKGPIPGVHKNPPDPLQALLADKGVAHEANFLKKIEAQEKVCRIEAEPGETSSSRFERTITAMKAGEPYIYQAAMAGDTFFGYADLIQKVPGKSDLGDFHYEPVDMKIALTPKPTAVIQLCAYADALLKMQGRIPGNLTVVTKDGASHAYRTDHFFAFYQTFKSRFVEFHSKFDLNHQPLPLKSEEHRNWSIYAKRVLHEKDDVQLTARIRATHVESLRAAGITTLTALSKVDHSTKVENVAPDVLEALKKQAQLQIESNREEKLKYEVLPHEKGIRQGLAMLPDSHPMDIFFDMEGYPLLGNNGLEYLYGIAERGVGKTRYLEFWARSAFEEINAFKDFMTFALARWKANPGMRIYHYGHYEPSTLKRLMGQYGICERVMADLLRNEVFVDLYQVVLQGLRVGSYSYGLKAVEKLYYPDRETEVGSGAESAVEYANFLETGEEKFLDRIRLYNQDDCFSTKDLENFLREIKNENRIQHVPIQSEEQRAREVDPEKIQERCSRKAEELLAGIPEKKRGLPFEEAEPAHYVQEILSQMLDFHRREESPDWSDYFRRRDLSQDQLSEDVSALIGVEITKVISEEEFECKFKLDQETKFRLGEEVLILENANPIERLKISAWDILRGTLTLSGEPSMIPEGKFTLAPAKSFIRKDALLKALLSQAESFAPDQERFGLRESVYDLLLRRPPRLSETKPGEPLIKPGESSVDGAIRLALGMNGGCLCVQGPPGTGKTFTGSRVIAALLKAGKTIAISSNSNTAINNLIRKVDEVCNADRSFCRPIKLASSNSLESDTNDLSDCEVPVKENKTTVNVLFGTSKKPVHKEGPCNVVGGTAFLLCKDDFKDRFDYLFVDEATQVALPNIVSMANCARNVVLMGDQMQLGQPTKAVHPGDSGSSALVHLTGGKAVIDPSEGIFLPITYRMHPKVNAVISELFYEGALESDKSTDKQEIVWAKSESLNLPSNGIHFLGIDHSGNTHGSEEEADEIKRIMELALKSKWRDKRGELHDFTFKDILVVTPYNYQVSLLREKLGSEARVGSVDLFQGQEAPLVLLSLCASTTADAPRGIAFLLDRNRMNVALSRAQSLAVVVGSPKLAAGRVSNVSGMRLMNVICRLANN